MILDKKRAMGAIPMVVTHALSEIKEAVRELRDSTPGSALVRLAEQKIEMMERGECEDFEFPRDGRKISARQNS